MMVQIGSKYIDPTAIISMEEFKSGELSIVFSGAQPIVLCQTEGQLLLRHLSGSIRDIANFERQQKSTADFLAERRARPAE